MRVLCTLDQADALLRDAGPAVSVLRVLQLEAVGRAMTVVRRTPSQNLLNMVAELRSELGSLIAGV